MYAVPLQSISSVSCECYLQSVELAVGEVWQCGSVAEACTASERIDNQRDPCGIAAVINKSETQLSCITSCNNVVTEIVLLVCSHYMHAL